MLCSISALFYATPTAAARTMELQRGARQDLVNNKWIKLLIQLLICSELPACLYHFGGKQSIYVYLQYN
ncbi:hypothetical protein SETIT_4G138000v2 [Setaria italica]|uniref:Uncharacterized protein n=1 Tax=Setaria italica TaxID=4555 RepID=A0A368QUD2_SETIT|nr:hypothetical protein SETIT_4G138000v2 [Setaria italica]